MQKPPGLVKFHYNLALSTLWPGLLLPVKQPKRWPHHVAFTAQALHARSGLPGRALLRFLYPRYPRNMHPSSLDPTSMRSWKMSLIVHVPQHGVNYMPPYGLCSSPSQGLSGQLMCRLLAYLSFPQGGELFEGRGPVPNPALHL